jgi:hypothetical protein
MIPASPKTTIGIALLLTLALGAPRFAQAAASSPASSSAPTLQQRIDALLKFRLKPEPLPVNPPNPFQMTGGAKRESGAGPEDVAAKPATQEEIAAAATAVGESAAKELAGNASEVLITCASRLKLGGVIILKDQIQIVVNGVPRKEGDTVAADWNNTIVYLKVAKLLPGQLVLRYGEAEATLKF